MLEFFAWTCTRADLESHRFGMAEQAVNTIYLLGEQPDLLCGSVIKNLTSKVFIRPEAEFVKPVSETEKTTENDDLSSPAKTSRSRASSSASASETHDHAGAFALAQLVFVVGHVAIKHIVYLELVEREFKRRKDENAKRE